MTEERQEGAGQQRDNSPPARGIDELFADSLDLAAPVLGEPAVAEIEPLPDSKGLKEQVRQLHAELVNEDPARAARWGGVLLRVYQRTLHRVGAKREKRDRAAKLYIEAKAEGLVVDRLRILDIAGKVPCDEKTVREAIREVGGQK